MPTKEKIIQRNKKILTIANLVFVFLIFALTILTSKFNNEPLYFHYVTNGNGEPLGLFLSLFLYLIYWFFIGTCFFAVTFLFSLLIYMFLHRKEPSFGDGSSPDLPWSGFIAFIASFVATFILIVLHVSNIATVNTALLQFFFWFMSND